MQLKSSASDRKIEHYESVWQEDGDSGEYLLDRPRLSFDEIHTRNTIATAQLGYKPNERHSWYAKTYYQDYSDYSYRNRLELQFGNADRIRANETMAADGSVTRSSFKNARSRRYFGDTQNERERRHHTIGGAYTGAEWTIDYSLYSHKWDLNTVWNNWNFTESGLGLGYTIEDPHFPTISENDDTDLQNISAANFSSLRVHNTDTKDRDLAARLDAERKIQIGNQELWIQTGVLHREKERDTQQKISVFLPSSETNFTLQEVAYSGSGTSILDGSYTVPLGLDPQKSRSFVSSEQHYFSPNDYRSKVETAPQSYSARESVTSAYLQGIRTQGDLTIEFGGRIERTKTETRGTVVIPEPINDPNEGTELETILNPSSQTLQIIKNLYSRNDYNSFTPSAELTFQTTPYTNIKAAWYQLLMRPQYFNIVDYRRVSIPTRSISEGNPNLEPTEIDKFRLAWTRESVATGTLSIETYLIKVENFFYGSVSQESIQESGVPTPYRVSRVENGKEANIKGFEVQWRKTVSDFAFFDQVSTTLAYTFSDSEASVDSRPNESLPTPERSDHLFKVNWTGAIGDYSSSIDMTYQSEALDDLGNSRAEDKYREPVLNVSIQNSYSINQNTSVSLNLFNVTDHPERSYEGSPLRVTRNQYSSWFTSLIFTRSF